MTIVNRIYQGKDTEYLCYVWEEKLDACFSNFGPGCSSSDISRQAQEILAHLVGREPFWGQIEW